MPRQDSDYLGRDGPAGSRLQPLPRSPRRQARTAQPRQADRSRALPRRAGEGRRSLYLHGAGDRSRGPGGAASKPLTVSALPRIEGPVFVAHFENSPDSESGMKGTLKGKAAYCAGRGRAALDLRNGGWDEFAHDPMFDVTGDLTIEAWVKFESLAAVPMVLSHGQWHGAGFFVQG